MIESQLKDVTNKMRTLEKSNQNLSQALISKSGGESSVTKGGKVTNPGKNIHHNIRESKRNNLQVTL